MRRRDHPQVGDVWMAYDRIIWTILDKEYDEDSQTWALTILIGGDANGDEGKTKIAYLNKDFSELEGIYWKVG